MLVCQSSVFEAEGVEDVIPEAPDNEVTPNQVGLSTHGHDSSHVHLPPPIDPEFLRPAKWLKTHGFDGISPTLPYVVTDVQEKPIAKVGLQCL